MIRKIVGRVLLLAYPVFALACNPSTSECLFSYALSPTHSISYYSNGNLNTTDAKVTRLVIGVHGNERNAKGLVQTLYKAASTERKLASTLIIAPSFKVNEYQGGTSCSDNACDPITNGELFWTDSGWKQGDNSISKLSMSSFAIIDKLINTVISSNYYPNLKQIVITGHSAGGQFTQRYAIGTSIDIALPNSVSISYLVTNPSSYLYLDEKRPTWAGLYTEGGVYPTFGLHATAVVKPDFLDPYIRSQIPYSELDEFRKIKNSLNSTSGSDCQCTGNPPCSYERYKYGFDIEPIDSLHYMCSVNAYQSCANGITTHDRINQYLNKKVTYLLGQLDNSTTSGSRDANADLDVTCGGNFQGADRLSRGTFYYESLSQFGKHQHRLLFAANVGHSASQMYASYEGRKALFGGDLPVKSYIAPYYTMRQAINKRYLDAAISSPYTATTNTSQSDWTQNWLLTKVGENEYRIQQQKTLMYLEGASSPDYAVSLKYYANTDAQIWIFIPTGDANTYTIQHKSTMRYLDADTSSKYLVKTQLKQSDLSQQWMIKIMS